MLKEAPNPHWQNILAVHLQKAKRPLIVILGPTASGKTAFSLEVVKWVGKHPLPAIRPRAHGREAGEGRVRGPSPQSSPNGRGRYAAEIINADSRQLYKHMDIGTAKITTGEMRGIPHHLLSVRDPKEEVTVGWYKQTAEKVIDDVLDRGSTPILVGGSMLYISAVTDGYVFTGRGGKRVMPVPYDLLIFGLQWPRGELVKRIEERTKKSLGLLPSPATAGEGTGERETWLSEVEWLLKNGYQTSDSGMKSHGYREIAEWIKQEKRTEDLPALIERINAVTRRYAKRQMTWWKGDERIQWISCN